MTKTYSSKKTKMKRGKYGRIGHCRCSHCINLRLGRNHKRSNKFRLIFKFDVIPGNPEINKINKY